MEELKGIGGFHSKPRYFKVGDVIRWVPMYAKPETVRERGLAVVTKAEGCKFDAYFLGNGHRMVACDARIPPQFQLQDSAPIPQVAEWVENNPHIFE